MGCSKNLVDSEVLMKQLEYSNFHVVFEPRSLQNIHTVIINTCGFIEEAKQESVDTILRYAEAKKAGRISRLFIMGCLTQRYRDELRTEIPEADEVFGVNELPEIIRVIGGEYRHTLLGERKLTTPSHVAYLKIAEGCDRTCSFCAIPSIRGPHRSKPIEEIVAETVNLAERGVKELLVISQDTTYYGVDLYRQQRLADLLRKLASVRGIEWIRLHYTYPLAFPKEVLDVIRNHSNICNYLDIPLQHISNHILHSMKRGMTGDKIRALIDMIRNTVPDIALRTTFITGYPGESEKDFDELCHFVTDSRFDRLGVFTYSHEEGTSAFQLQDSVPEKIKQMRQSGLMQIQEQISLKKNQEMVGKVIKVLLDREEDEFWIGRSEADSLEVDQEVLVRNTAEPLHVGIFYRVLIKEASHFDLLGEIDG